MATKTVKVKAHKRLSGTGKIENVDAHLRKIEGRMDIGGGRSVEVRKGNDPTFMRDGKGNILPHSTTFVQAITETFKYNTAMRQNTIEKHRAWVGNGFSGSASDKKMLKTLIKKAESGQL